MNSIITVRNKCNQMHIYEYDWNLVYDAYNSRFPICDLIPELIETRFENRNIYGNIETYSRYSIYTCNDIPWIIKKMIGINVIEFKSEAIIDKQKKTFYLHTENITLRNFIELDEICYYGMCEKNKKHTIFEQTGHLKILKIPKIIAYTLERYLIKKYEKGCMLGRNIDEILINEKIKEIIPSPTYYDCEPEGTEWKYKPILCIVFLCTVIVFFTGAVVGYVWNLNWLFNI